jgi:hypothetical protein
VNSRLYVVSALITSFVLVGGCAGGGSSASAPMPQSVIAPLGLQAPSEAQSDAIRQPQRRYVSSTADLLYVGNQGNNSITVYHHDAQGNSAPIAVIAGSRTKINNPGQLSEDAAGNLYVANLGPSVLVFARGANGNVAPIRVISGPLTGLHYANAMTVDQTTGKIFVVDTVFTVGNTSGQSSVLVRFPPNAKGNMAPFARSAKDGVFIPNQIVSDSTGNNLIEPHIGSVSSTWNLSAGVDTIPKQFYDGASLPLVYGLSFYYAFGVADDPSTQTYQPTTSSGIDRFREVTVGHPYLFQFNSPASFAPALVSTITSETCGRQIALGYLRNIYVVHDCGDGSFSVNVYTHDSMGSVKPLRVLSGAAPKMNKPFGLYEGP